MTSLDEGNVYYQNQGPFEGTQVDAADDGAPAMSRHTAKRKFREFLAAYKDATTDEMIYRERCETLRNAEDAHKVSRAEGAARHLYTPHGSAMQAPRGPGCGPRVAVSQGAAGAPRRAQDRRVVAERVTSHLKWFTREMMCLAALPPHRAPHQSNLLPALPVLTPQPSIRLLRA